MRSILFLGLASVSSVLSAAERDVREFGAKGDGVVKDTVAIQKAIDAAAAQGGGTVRLGAGTYLSGSLYLKSGVDFLLDEGATLKGSPDRADYNALGVCPQNWASKAESASGAHLLLCIEQTNVTVRGKGRIDGNCATFLLGQDGKPWPGGQGGIPWRPSQMLYFVESDNVRVEGVTLVDSPYWSCFFHGCTRVAARNLRIRTRRQPFHTHNGDGIDIDCCEDVVVSGCDIDTADDSITLRADVARLKHPRPCARVSVSDCRLASTCNAIRIGVGDGEVRDAMFRGIKVHDTRTAVDMVSSWKRGGRGVSFKNISFCDMDVEAVLFCRIYPKFAKETRIDDIRFANVKGRVDCASWITGRERSPIGKVLFKNVNLLHGVVGLNVESLSLHGCRLERKVLSQRDIADYNRAIDERDSFPCEFRGTLHESIQRRRRSEPSPKIAGAVARPIGRVAFERGEEGAELLVEFAGEGGRRMAVPVETRLKPGRYSVEIPGATNKVEIAIGQTFADRMPVVMWGGGMFSHEVVRDFGFTHVLSHAGFTDTNDISRQTRNLINIYDDALAEGMRFMHSVKVQYPVKGAARKRFYRRLRGGKKPTNPREANQPEVSNPELVEYARRIVAAENEAVGYHPGFAGVLPVSEWRDKSFPSFNTEHLRYKAETGRDVPPEVRKRVLEFPIARQRFPDGVVPVDDPLYVYYSWFWGGGDGWPGYLGGIAAEYRKTAGRYGDGCSMQRKRPFFSFWDPAVRCPPKWGSGGDVDVISQWVYAQPEPMNVAGPAEEVIAMAEGRPGQLPMIMTQLICYRAQIAPTNVIVSPLPEWVKRRPRASFPTIPADSFQEAVWSMLSKPVKGIMFHGMRTIFESGAETGYTYTSPETAMRVKSILHDLVAPLGPTLKGLGRAEPEVAVLESFVTPAFGGPGPWGWLSSPITFLQRARLDPRVVYEETILRDGFGGTKILYAPQCMFLSSPVVDKIREFQKSGGILVADKKLLPALKADVIVPVMEYRKPPKSDHIADVEAISKAAVAAKAQMRTRKAKADMQDAAESLRRALAERYGYKPRADSSSPEIVVYSRAWRGTPYVFAVNDMRTFGDYVGQWGLTMEKGLPFIGSVTLSDPERKVGAVYELSRGGEVSFTRLADGRLEVPLAYDTNDGRLLLFLERKIASIEVKTTPHVKPGETMTITMTVRDDAGNPVSARLPVEIHVFDAAGTELDGAGYACAEDGVCVITLPTNLNDAPGGYRVICRDRASGLSTEAK